MRIKDISNIARKHGHKPPGLNKAALIHLIQRTEGNFDCFASAMDGRCDQLACLWRRDCLQQSAKSPAKIHL